MSWVPYVESEKPKRNASLNTYRKQKLRILERDFCIRLTEEEVNHANSLKTEAQIDQFFLGCINRRWG